MISNFHIIHGLAVGKFAANLYKLNVLWYNKHDISNSRVEICALSAIWTGSCHTDEKRPLAVQVSHPAAAYRSFYASFM